MRKLKYCSPGLKWVHTVRQEDVGKRIITIRGKEVKVRAVFGEFTQDQVGKQIYMTDESFNRRAA